VNSTINRPKEISIAFIDALLLGEFQVYRSENFPRYTGRLQGLAERPKVWRNFR